VPGLAEFIAAYGRSGAWVTLDAFTAPDSVLGGLSPRSALLAGGAASEQLHVLLRAEADDQGP
jgi:hypothetical protein